MAYLEESMSCKQVAARDQGIQCSDGARSAAWPLEPSLRVYGGPFGVRSDAPEPAVLSVGTGRGCLKKGLGKKGAMRWLRWRRSEML